MPSEVNTSSNKAVNLLSRFGVTTSTCTRRVACSATAKQYRRVSVIVSTLKKSQAKIPDA